LVPKKSDAPVTSHVDVRLGATILVFMETIITLLVSYSADVAVAVNV
jgi:hypothetical protein